jgi:RNA polymerase sigma-70 factor (ECF subfamily)
MYDHQASRVEAFEKEFNLFIESTRPKLLAYVLRLLPVAEAEEVLQETHLKFYYIALEQFSVNSTSNTLKHFTPLMFSIAKNLAISRIRHQKVILKYKESVEDSYINNDMSTEISLVESDEKEKLQAAISHLPPMCKQVFVQRKIHNKSHAEIAQAFNISTKTVENHISKGLKLCREFMISARDTSIQNTSNGKAKTHFAGGKR